MKILVFAEKPSVGRDIAKVLGATKRAQGFLEGPKYVITWGIGHLISIAPPEAQNPQWKRWRLDTLPMIPQNWELQVLEPTKDQFSVVKQLLTRDDIAKVINAADAGREGELIFRLVYQTSKCQKPIQRLWISSMTDEAIKDGFANLKPGKDFEPLASAALCRSRADWLVGMNFTRCYTKKFGAMFTLGRVQTPTLAMIVQRHQEIANFTPQDFWEIKADLSDFGMLWFAPGEKENSTRILDKNRAQELASELPGQEIILTQVKKSKKKQPPPLLYDLTTLQRDANSRYGMTAARTLVIAQGLYERKKVITYPRTDSRHLSEDIFPTIPRRLAALPPDYGVFLEPLRINRPTKKKRVFDDKKVTDHHAIIPTEQKNPSTDRWTEEERRIYDLVARRFLAAFYPDYEYLSTSVIGKSGDNFFKASGRVETVLGWRALDSNRDSAKKESTKEKGSDVEGEQDDNQALPPLKKGDTRIIQKVDLLTKKTKPPANYTESSLLQAMETAGKLIDDDELRAAMKDSGLGTPATRAEIIEKLIRVGYMVREGKKLIPTNKGIQLISLAVARIASPELTGQWEKRLSDISRSKDSGDAFMADITTFVKEIIDEIKTKQVRSTPATKVSPPRKTYGLCPACGKGSIIEGKRGFGCDRYREGCHYVVWKEFFGRKLTESAIKLLIAGKPTRLLKGFQLDDGKKVDGKLQMNQDKSGIELVESSGGE